MEKNVAAWNAQTEYACEFQHGGTSWAMSIFAVDFDDAAAKLESLKNSMVLLGEIKEVIAFK